jgi:hypothetical protein
MVDTSRWDIMKVTSLPSNYIDMVIKPFDKCGCFLSNGCINYSFIPISIKCNFIITSFYHWVFQISLSPFGVKLKVGQVKT